MRAAEVKGGQATLDREKKITEENESLNIRTPDALDTAIADLTGNPNQGCILNYTFEITHEFSRPTYETFDRYYSQHKLLVHYFSKNYPYLAAKEEGEAELERKTAFAKKQGCKFLPIFDGEVTEVDLAKVLGAL